MAPRPLPLHSMFRLTVPPFPSPVLISVPARRFFLSRIFLLRHWRRTSQTRQYNLIIGRQIVHNLQVFAVEPFGHPDPAKRD